MVAVIPWVFIGSSKYCRPHLLISNFARGGDMMIENEGTGGTRLYCRWCAVGLWDAVTNTPTQGVVGWYLRVGNEVLAAAQFSSYNSRVTGSSAAA